VGIDVEDVRMALTGGDSTRIAIAKATGKTRAQDALNLALLDLGHATPESSALDGLLVIFAGASDSLSLKEAGMAIKQLRPDLGPNVHFAYCLLHDDSLGVELRVTVFATNSCGQ
jgi:cell division GTPase FtsZ